MHVFSKLRIRQKMWNNHPHSRGCTYSNVTSHVRKVKIINEEFLNVFVLHVNPQLYATSLLLIILKVETLEMEEQDAARDI